MPDSIGKPPEVIPGPLDLEIDMSPAEEVPASEVRVGEWYLWKTHGWGVNPEQVIYLCDPPKAASTGCWLKPSPQRPFTYTAVSLQEYARSVRSYRDTTRYNSQTFRLKNPPTALQTHILRESLFWQMLSWAARPSSGCDPEFFIEDAQGQVIPAYQFLPGKKLSEPLFWDGFQAEFVTPPRSCMDELGMEILKKLQCLRTVMPPGSRISPRSVVGIPPEVLASARQEHVDFGCRPSLNAYGLRGQVVPDPRELPIRFAGGHFHWGTRATYGHKPKPDYEALASEAVKLLDATIGLIGVSIFERLDDPRRRQYYGLAGEYRLPDHGLEYRVLSNAAYASPSIYHLLFTLGRTVVMAGFEGLREKLQLVPEAAVVQAINNCDVPLARRLLKESEPVLRKLIGIHWPSGDSRDFTWDCLFKPMEDFGVDMSKCFENWTNLGCNGIELSGSYRERWSSFCRKHREAKHQAEVAQANSLGGITFGNTPQSPSMPNVQGNSVAF